ncbi:MAG: hypothetical protein ACTS1X_08875 [Parasphingopyxis sp.]|uniref:hypothetical protein n=1 Tax=Parasphingopyxis sp. TaxID=1920299 RepID=UPI003FA169A2
MTARINVATAAAAAMLALSASTAHGSELQKGACQQFGPDVSQLLFVMGYGSVGQINCRNATIDWQGRISFLYASGPNRGEPLLSFIGSPSGREYSLIVAEIEDSIGRRNAEGQCQLSVSSGDDRRRIFCFATTTDAEPTLAFVTRFEIADSAREIGVDHYAEGHCDLTHEMRAMITDFLVAAAYDETGEMLEVAGDLNWQCGAMRITSDNTRRFAGRSDPGEELAFSGTITSGDRQRMLIDQITLPDGSSVAAVGGSCVDTRQADGSLHTSCGALYRQGDDYWSAIVMFSPSREN